MAAAGRRVCVVSVAAACNRMHTRKLGSNDWGWLIAAATWMHPSGVCGPSGAVAMLALLPAVQLLVVPGSVC